MLIRLLLLFTVVPLVELVLLIKLAQATSLTFTLAVIAATGILGTWLARHQGMRVWLELNRRVGAGEVPARELIGGMMIFVAGALLLTPGLLTDALGFVLLIPQTREMIVARVTAWLRRKIDEGTIKVYSHGGWHPISHEPPAGSPPLEDE